MSLIITAVSSYFPQFLCLLTIDKINENTLLLPNREVKLIWADTQCNATKTLELKGEFMKLGVGVYIGYGCADCEMAAKMHGEEEHTCTVLCM